MTLSAVSVVIWNWQLLIHDDVIKWKHFPRYWSFVRGIHRSPANFPHKDHSRGALVFSLICVWIKAWVNSREAGDSRRYRAHYDVFVITIQWFMSVPAFTKSWDFLPPRAYFTNRYQSTPSRECQFCWASPDGRNRGVNSILYPDVSIYRCPEFGDGLANICRNMTIAFFNMITFG